MTNLDTLNPSSSQQFLPQNEDFSHIDGDVEDFIFSFVDNKLHSEK